MKPIRPDMIWGPPKILSDLEEAQGNGESSQKTYVITEMKLTLERLRRDAKPDHNQFTGFKRYTKSHTGAQKLVSFFILFSGTGNSQSAMAKEARIQKKIKKNYGMHAIIVTLVNAQSPFTGR